MIKIGTNLGTEFQAFLAQLKATAIVVITDSNTINFCYPKLKDYLPAHQVITVPAGEENKHLGTCTSIWEKLTEFGLDRKALVINLGGGVIGDMGGFCAATYKRGIRFIQMPTSLLSMVDASVGGKLGVDFKGFKNHIGVFQIPEAVFIDTQFLATLPENEKRSGYAEVLKHTLIADAEEWHRIKNKSIADFDWATQIKHQVAIKEAVVTADPTEKGLRKILNFGHTLGHAIESFYLETPNRLLHGEAIAIGMITEAFLSQQLGYISQNDLEEITAVLLRIYGKVEIDSAYLEEILQLTLQDKKNESAQVQFALLEKIGKANYDQVISKEVMNEALEYYIQLS